MATIKINTKASPFPILTINQLASITGRDRDWINNKTRMQNKEGQTHLDIAYPYPNSEKEEDINTGPKFIVRDDKCEEFIKKCLKKPLKRS